MFIEINEQRIRVKVSGKGEPIVLLPGWGCALDHWIKVSNYFANRFRIISIDLPGFGLSSKPRAIWGTPEYAMLVAECLKRLGIKNPIIIGHSFGGKIAFYMVAKQLVTAKKMILIASSGIRLKKKFSQLVKIYTYKLFKKIALLPGINIFFKSMLDVYQNKLGSLDYRTAQGIMRSILVKLVNEDFRDLLPNIQIPVLLFWGAKDTSTSLFSGKLMHELFPKSNLVVFPDAGHFPHLTNFTEFINTANEFLSED